MTRILLDDDDEKSLKAIEIEMDRLIKQYGIIPVAAYLANLSHISVYQGLVESFIPKEGH